MGKPCRRVSPDSPSVHSPLWRCCFLCLVCLKERIFLFLTFFPIIIHFKTLWIISHSSWSDPCALQGVTVNSSFVVCCFPSIPVCTCRTCATNKHGCCFWSQIFGAFSSDGVHNHLTAFGPLACAPPPPPPRAFFHPKEFPRCSFGLSEWLHFNFKMAKQFHLILGLKKNKQKEEEKVILANLTVNGDPGCDISHVTKAMEAKAIKCRLLQRARISSWGVGGHICRAVPCRRQRQMLDCSQSWCERRSTDRVRINSSVNKCMQSVHVKRTFLSLRSDCEGCL